MSDKQRIEAYAKSIGIDLMAVAPVEVYSDYVSEMKTRLNETDALLRDFMIGDDEQAFFQSFSSPLHTLPAAKSVIILGVYAYDEQSGYRHCHKERRCKTARTYSYYPVVRQLTQQLAAYIQSMGFKTAEGQHIPLKYAASKIGLGHYGRNGVLYTKEYGSFTALRNIITDMPLAPDRLTGENLCTECSACIKACPTGALYAPYKVNPKLCLNPIGRQDAYIAPQMRENMRNWLRGCDICQEVCPTNKALTPREVHPLAGFDSKKHSSHKDLDGLEKCPEALTLIGRQYPWSVRRNAIIALGNMCKHDAAVVEELQSQMKDMDAELQEYCVWAINRIRGDE